MKKSLQFVLLLTVCLFLVASKKNGSFDTSYKVQYFFAAGENTSFKKAYRATSNVFSLDCARVDLGSLGRQFSEFYKSEYSQSSDNYISGACYGPYDSYEEASKKRNSKIADQKYLCNAPDCVVILAQGFRPVCR